MMPQLHLCLIIILLVFLSGLPSYNTAPKQATQYVVRNNVPNSPGGRLFDEQIGADFARVLMARVNKFIYAVFQQSLLRDRKRVTEVDLIIADIDDYANISDHRIFLGAPAIAEWWQPPNWSRRYFNVTIHKEMTHVFQWDGYRDAPRGLTEGIAAFVVAKAGLGLSYYGRPSPVGVGNRWDEGYQVTGKFLLYLDSKSGNGQFGGGFVAELNKKIRNGYSDDYFLELTGKPVDELWREYKDEFERNNGAYVNAATGASMDNNTMFDVGLVY